MRLTKLSPVCQKYSDFLAPGSWRHLDTHRNMTRYAWSFPVIDLIKGLKREYACRSPGTVIYNLFVIGSAH